MTRWLAAAVVVALAGAASVEGWLGDGLGEWLMVVVAAVVALTLIWWHDVPRWLRRLRRA